jgi:flavin reductase (DIM6/NTAB) family NADH-FMN oxidoreductase RutF
MTGQPIDLAGEPPPENANPELLRQIMRHWTTGVSILTSRDGSTMHGMTVNSFTSISLDPPVVQVSLAIMTRTNAMVKTSGVFGISILGEDQAGLADRFAGHFSDEADRFSGLAINHLATGSPMIEGSLAFLDCRVRTSLEIGRTTVFFGDVVAAKELSGNQPLVYFNRLYRRLQK